LITLRRKKQGKESFTGKDPNAAVSEPGIISGSRRKRRSALLEKKLGWIPKKSRTPLQKNSRKEGSHPNGWKGEGIIEDTGEKTKARGKKEWIYFGGKRGRVERLLKGKSHFVGEELAAHGGGHTLGLQPRRRKHGKDGYPKRRR